MTKTSHVATAPITAWRSRIVGHADVPPAELVPNPRNWRTHPADQQRALAGALSEVGWVAEVLVNRTTGHVVDGHLRIELALERHEPSVPVTYVELTEDEERIVLATLDPLAAMAEAEASSLAQLLAGLDPADDALRALLDDLARENDLDALRAGLVDPDDLPSEPGLYAWWVRDAGLPGVPRPPHPTMAGWGALYVGRAPTSPSSGQTLRTRILGNHVGGNTGSSTFRSAWRPCSATILRGGGRSMSSRQRTTLA